MYGDSVLKVIGLLPTSGEDTYVPTELACYSKSVWSLLAMWLSMVIAVVWVCVSVGLDTWTVFCSTSMFQRSGAVLVFFSALVQFLPAANTSFSADAYTNGQAVLVRVKRVKEYGRIASAIFALTGTLIWSYGDFFSAAAKCVDTA